MRKPKTTVSSLKRFAWLSLFVGAFSGSLPLIDYTRQDATISEPTEVLLLMAFFAVIGLGLLANYSLWLKSNSQRLIASIIATYVLTEAYGSILRPVGWLKDSLGTVKTSALAVAAAYILAGVVAIVLGYIERYVEKRQFAEKPLETIAQFICIIVLALNVYKFAAYLYNHNASSSYQPSKTVNFKPQWANKESSQRDIYYFVFDRYANRQSLQDYFGFDNSQFLKWLQDSGFTIREDAFSNYQTTAPSLASTLRMDYHIDIAEALPGLQPLSSMPYKKLIEDSLVASHLRQAGYITYNFGNWWNLTRKQKEAINVLPSYEASLFGKSFIISELQTNVISKTFLGGILKRAPSVFGKTIVKVPAASPRDLYLTQLSEVSNIAKQHHDKPRFIFAHFLNPHPPYVFDSNGDPPPYNMEDNNTGAAREIKYVNQLQYANRTIRELVTTIKKSSKTEPIIILQADEGPYYLKPLQDWRTAPEEALKLKLGVLAAYSLPGVSAEEAAKIDSSVNIFRFVFNNYFGASLNYLPDCSYVSNYGNRPFVLYDITPKLHQRSLACPSHKSE